MRAPIYLVVLIIVVLCLPAVPASAQRIYWVTTPATTGRIQRAHYDGSSAEVLIDDLENPQVVAVDTLHEHLYYNQQLGGRLNRSDLHGLVAEELMALAEFTDLALDPKAKKLYWVESISGRLRRANLDGSGASTVLSGLQAPTALALDPQAGKVYWASHIQAKIRRANLNGTGQEDVASDVGSVYRMALHPGEGALYYTTPAGVQRLIPGAGPPTTIVSCAFGCHRGLAVDTERDLLFFANSTSIWSAGLDGSDVKIIVDGFQIGGLAVDPRECSGHGQSAKGECHCDSGWGGDDCDCSLAACPGDCSDLGTCICGICACQDGWAGEDCSCPAQCPGDCSGHGDCTCGECACDAQYAGDDCSCFTGPCPNNCSGNGDCDCGTCVCDPGWDGPDCSCRAQDCPGDCAGHGDCACGVCTCDPGWFGPDCGQETPSPFRVFMMVDGLQHVAAPFGPTTYVTPAGEDIRVLAWMQDVSPRSSRLNALQLIWSWSATPLAGATGTVSYVDDHPGVPGGDSVRVDTLRPDWVFSALDPLLVVNVFNETHAFDLFGMYSMAAPGFFVDTTATADIRYLAQFELQVSSDASGPFELWFNRPPVGSGPFSALFTSNGALLPVDEFQPLRLIIGGVQPLSVEPPDGSIDARGPAPVDAAGPVLRMQFNGEAQDVSPSDFLITVTGGSALHIKDMTVSGNTVTVQLDRPFPPSECTTIDHVPSDWHAVMRSLPGDVDGDGTAAPRDILALINHLNDVPPALPEWSCDINWSGVCDSLDILALIDLLNGAGGGQPWLWAQAPECP